MGKTSPKEDKEDHNFFDIVSVSSLDNIFDDDTNMVKDTANTLSIGHDKAMQQILLQKE